MRRLEQDKKYDQSSGIITAVAECSSEFHPSNIVLGKSIVRVINFPQAYIVDCIDDPWINLSKAIKEHIRDSCGFCDYGNIQYKGISGAGNKPLWISVKDYRQSPKYHSP